jgi:anti-sigma-K factor RskA
MTNITQDDAALAGEYVLGLLDHAAFAQASARIATDTDFAAEVRGWQERLIPLLDTDDQTAVPDLWPQIEARIMPETGQDRSAPSLRIWQGMTALSASVAAVLGLMLANQPIPPQPSVPTAALLAALSGEGNPSALTARYDRDTGQLLMTPVILKTGALYPELWIIPEGGTPQSLGMIDSKAPTQMIVAPGHRTLIDRGATFAITPEHNGGSPSGKPTGAVIASGKITSL